MKLCLAQTRPVKGDILANIEQHKRFVATAVSHHTDLIIFPELSLTGYEPTLAKQLATQPEDGRLAGLQTLSNHHQIIIGVGLPTANDGGICISLVLFMPDAARQIYSKNYLHPDEDPFFVSGPNLPALKIHDTRAALAICYELSIPQHAEQAAHDQAAMYIASVAKSAQGVTNASQRLSDIARRYAVTAAMVNCVGPSDNFMSAGKTAVWSEQGQLLGQLDDTNEGIIVYDTKTQVLIKKMM